MIALVSYSILLLPYSLSVTLDPDYDLQFLYIRLFPICARPSTLSLPSSASHASATMMCV